MPTAPTDKNRAPSVNQTNDTTTKQHKMKFANFCVALAAASMVSCTTITVAQVDAVLTDSPVVLEKRARKVVMNKDYKKLQQMKAGEASSSAAPTPWLRTIYSNKKEIVTPTVVGGVTFSAKPPTTTNGLEPWISLKKDGSPVTIKPKMKNGNIQNKSPDYSTWFQNPVTIQYTKEELQAHNQEDDQIFTHVEYEAEDLTYKLLNPIFRCTPPSYKKKGLAKDTSSEPFCFPQDNAVLKMDKTYFVTWYYRFFDEEVKNVKVHLSYVKEAASQKGLKRDLAVNNQTEESDVGDESENEKRSSVIELGGLLDGKSFFVSDWLAKDEGYFPITVDPKWFGENDYYRKVTITLQPDNVPDEEFERLKNYVVIEIAKGAKVSKGSHQDLKKQEEREKLKAQYGEDYVLEEGIDEKYLIILSLPTCVLLAAFGMYLFVLINKRNTDLSFLKKVKFNRNKKRSKYTELPQWEGSKKD